MKGINGSEKERRPTFALKVASGRSVPQHVSEWLIRVAREGVNALPDPLRRNVKDELREAHQTAVKRWWRWKESRSMRSVRMPKNIDESTGEWRNGPACLQYSPDALDGSD